MQSLNGAGREWLTDFTFLTCSEIFELLQLAQGTEFETHPGTRTRHRASAAPTGLS
jgi:hypothetical protein